MRFCENEKVRRASHKQSVLSDEPASRFIGVDLWSLGPERNSASSAFLRDGREREISALAKSIFQ